MRVPVSRDESRRSCRASIPRRYVRGMDTTTNFTGERPLAVSPDQAAKLLGISRDTFDKHILPRLGHRVAGRRVLIPYAEIEAYINECTVLARGGGLSRG